MTRIFFFILFFLHLGCAMSGTTTLSGKTTLETLWDSSKLVVIQEPMREWCATSLCVRMDIAPDQKGMVHLLEHLVLRRLRNNDLPFWLDAQTGEHWMLFRCAHFPQRTLEAFSLLQTIFQPLTMDSEEIRQELDSLEYESMHNEKTSLPKITGSKENLENELKKLHARLFDCRSFCLVVLSPENSQTILHNAQKAFAMLSDKREEKSRPNEYEKDRTESRLNHPEEKNKPNGCEKDRTESRLNHPEEKNRPNECEKEESISKEKCEEDRFSLCLKFPGLNGGEFPYFTMLPQVIRYNIGRRHKKNVWKSRWHITMQSSHLIFSLAHKENDNDGSLEDMYDAISNSLDLPVEKEAFQHIQKCLMSEYYQHLEKTQDRLTVLSIAWAGGYLQDVLSYPILLPQITPDSFRKWANLWWRGVHIHSPRPIAIVKNKNRQEIPEKTTIALQTSEDFSQFPDCSGMEETSFFQLPSTMVFSLRIYKKQWVGIGLSMLDVSKSGHNREKLFRFLTKIAGEEEGEGKIQITGKRMECALVIPKGRIEALLQKISRAKEINDEEYRRKLGNEKKRTLTTSMENEQKRSSTASDGDEMRGEIKSGVRNKLWQLILAQMNINNLYPGKFRNIALIAGDFDMGKLQKWGHTIASLLESADMEISVDARNRESAGKKASPDTRNTRNVTNPKGFSEDFSTEKFRDTQTQRVKMATLETDSGLVYGMAGKWMRAHCASNLQKCILMSVYLSDVLYKEVVLPGYAYHANAWYDPETEILATWAATKQTNFSKVQEILVRVLSDIPDSGRISEHLSPPMDSIGLREKSRLHCLMMREMDAKNFASLWKNILLDRDHSMEGAQSEGAVNN